MFADILVEYKVKSLDKTFTYKINNEIKDKLKVGMKVKVPFGKKYINGFVVNIHNNNVNLNNIKEVKEIVHENIRLNNELLKLGKFIKEKTLCSLMTAYQAMLPSSLKIKNQTNNYDSYISYIMLNKDVNIRAYINANQRSKKQIEILEKLLKYEKIEKSLLKGSSLNALLEKKMVKEVKYEKYRINVNQKKVSDNKLTEEQEKVFKTVKDNLNISKTYLLYGVTGSGKTEVYIHLIKEVIKKKKSALMLVPEITLSTQMIKRFYSRFGSKVAILHSSLSEGQRYDEYKKILNNDVDVVVGTRSAIFAPLNNLGIIIIDEEHSESYKQENNPRYNTLDIASFRSSYHNIPLILGSATPRLETMARAKKNVYSLIELKSRVNGAKLPKINIVNMQEEMKRGNLLFSEELKSKITNSLNNNKQVILLLNRRGHSTIITCQNCGYTYKCPHCEISLTYHKSTNNLRCHYCGYTTFKNKVCPKCKESALNYYGVGTEKLEIELQKIFSDAKIIRMDVDTTTKKGACEKIIKDFENHKYDILLGTQMISKGLDFNNVNLVGVVNADCALNLPDFKSREKTFSLLMQTAGRAGRNSDSGEVVIQTSNPDNPIFTFLNNHDYESFYNYEMRIRHTLDYPPYFFLTTIKIVSKNYEVALAEANKIGAYLKRQLNPKTIILGPTQSSIFKLNNVYRYNIIIKYKYDDKLIETLQELDELYVTKRDVYIEIDTTPSTI